MGYVYTVQLKKKKRIIRLIYCNRIITQLTARTPSSLPTKSIGLQTSLNTLAQENPLPLPDHMLEDYLRSPSPWL